MLEPQMLPQPSQRVGEGRGRLGIPRRPARRGREALGMLVHIERDWKAQVRLCARYRRLAARGKRVTVVVAAIAREIAAFLWAIVRHIDPGSQGASEA